MYRQLLPSLERWKDSPIRKPLVLNGARQVGKTWLLREFGHTCFDNVAYVRLDNNPDFAAELDRGYDVRRITRLVEAQSGQAVTPGQTLVILDEIQECPKALTALKYFCEEAPEQAIAVAGSLLGITFHRGTGFPVGKIDIMNLHPLSFREFLDATGNGGYGEMLDSGDPGTLATIAPTLEGLLGEYYYVGGMPEAVATFASGGSLEDVRRIQETILFGYERDISKHLTATEAERTLEVWRSIPTHLSHENKKFVFGQVRKGARGREYSAAITWLTQAGIATRVPRVNKPGIPLSAYADDKAFKLFLVDVGLLGAMAGLDAATLLVGNRAFTEFKGAFTEQYVCQALKAQEVSPYYWSAENSSGEVDFIVQVGGTVYPIEAKAKENLRARSLSALSRKNPEIQPRRFSMAGYRDQDWVRNVPLYAIGCKKYWALPTPSAAEVLRMVHGKARSEEDEGSGLEGHRSEPKNRKSETSKVIDIRRWTDPDSSDSDE